MKLNDFSTDEFFEACCVLTPCIADILCDDTLSGKLKEFANTEGKDLKSLAQKFAFFAKEINFFIPYLLGKKKESVFAILAVLNKTDVATIKKQKVGVTIAQIKEAIQDEELKQLFTYAEIKKA